MSDKSTALEVLESRLSASHAYLEEIENGIEQLAGKIESRAITAHNLRVEINELEEACARLRQPQSIEFRQISLGLLEALRIEVATAGDQATYLTDILDDMEQMIRAELVAGSQPEKEA